MRSLNPTKDIVSKIIQLSIEYGILTPYTGLIGTQEYTSAEEKERINKLVDEITKRRFFINVKTLKGDYIKIMVDEKFSIKSLKLLINRMTGTPVDGQRLIFAGKQLEDENTLKYYFIGYDSTIHMVTRLRGGIQIFSIKKKKRHQLLVILN